MRRTVWAARAAPRWRPELRPRGATVLNLLNLKELQHCTAMVVLRPGDDDSDSRRSIAESDDESEDGLSDDDESDDESEDGLSNDDESDD